MSWDFETEPEFQKQLDWINDFVRNEVEPLDLILGDPYDKSDKQVLDFIRPLQQTVKDHKFWACHLGPDLGGPGYGQLKLALMNEILGRSYWAPTIFGCQAPDSGNAEILAHYGSPSQKEKYLQPLLEGQISSCYSMTEPHAGADPALFTTRARKDGDEWVISGEKWFSSNASVSSFLIVMAVSDPEAGPYQGMSMFIVPTDTPGVEIVRDAHVVGYQRSGGHAYIRYNDVRVPDDHVLGAPGSAFAIAQTRLGGGRIHHGMRTIAQVRKAFDMMCERALSRKTRNGPLASLQMVQDQIAESWVEIEQFRLLVLRTAWLIDKHNDYRKVRKDIAAVKFMMPKVMSEISRRALHLHGALGVTTEMPFVQMMIGAESLGLADGPTEVHKVTVARQVLRDYKAIDGLWPSGHLPSLRAKAEEKYADFLETWVGNQ